MTGLLVALAVGLPSAVLLVVVAAADVARSFRREPVRERVTARIEEGMAVTVLYPRTGRVENVCAVRRENGCGQ